MPVSAYSLLEISDRGWNNPRTALVSQLIATWTVNELGVLSAVMSATDFHRLSIGRGLGKWVKWEHPTAGVWGGVITQTPADLGQGTITLTANDFGWLLSGRPSPIAFRQQTSFAGALMYRAMNDSLNPEPLPFTSIQCDESGPPLTMEWRGDDCLDIARTLASESGQQWDVTVARGGEISFAWRDQIGEDKTDRVLITDGAQVMGGDVQDDLNPLVNALIGVASDQSYERAERHYAESASSIRIYGRRLFVRRYDRNVTEGTIRATALGDLRREADPPMIPTITLSAEHPIGSEIRQGDRVRLWLAAKNARMTFRVMSRTVDLNSGSLTLTGDAEEVV